MPTSALDALISRLSRLPGLGPRSARRAVLYLLQDNHQHLLPLVTCLQEVAASIKTCRICANLDTSNPCSLCANSGRDQRVLCVVEDVGDLWALERSSSFNGVYHVLGGTLSALEGRGPDDIRIPDLLQRCTAHHHPTPQVMEVILALNATIDGQTSSHYIAARLREAGYTGKISRPSVGLPLGGAYDYMDDGTITTALESRHTFGDDPITPSPPSLKATSHQ